MKVLRDFSRAADALERIAARLAAAGVELGEKELVVERLNELERTRTLWEADVEALLQKADGKRHAAENAEARTRTMKKSYERFLDPLDPDSDEIEAELPKGYAPASKEEAVQPVHMGLEDGPKTNAVRSKFYV